MKINWYETIFCSVDTETTGINPENGDRIIEIAIIPIYQGKLIHDKAFVSLINPGIKIPHYTEKIHKISNESIRNAPAMRDVFPQIRYYFSQMLPVFHNGRFDLTFLDFSAKDIGEFPIDVSYIDTVDLSTELFGSHKSLEWLAKKFGITTKVAHRAYDDAVITAKVFIKLARKVGIENLGKFVKHWLGVPV